MDSDEYTLDDIVEIRSLTEHVCMRPGLYTATGSLEEVYSFINAINLPKYEAESKVAKLAVDWFARNADLKDGKMNFDALRDEYNSDADALRALLQELNGNVS